MMTNSNIPSMIVYDRTVAAVNSAATVRSYPRPGRRVWELFTNEGVRYYLSRNGKSGILPHMDGDCPTLLFFDTATDPEGGCPEIFFGETEYGMSYEDGGADIFSELSPRDHVLPSREEFYRIFNRYLTVCSCFINAAEGKDTVQSVDIHSLTNFIAGIYREKTGSACPFFNVKISPSVGFGFNIMMSKAAFCAFTFSVLTFLTGISGDCSEAPDIKLQIDHSNSLLTVRITAKLGKVAISSTDSSDVLPLCRMFPAQSPYLIVLSRLVSSNGIDLNYHGVSGKFVITFSIKAFALPDKISAPELTAEDIEKLRILADFLI